MKKILIPIDFQKQSLLALQQSYNLARKINAEILMLYVHEQSGILASLFSKDQHNELISRIDEKLAELAGKSSLISGLKVTYRVEKGRIYSKIVEVAQEIKADYIIMGTHSSEEFEEHDLRIGANASKVVRSAVCPVITYNTDHSYNGCRNILLPVDFTKETTQKVTKCIEIAKIYGAGIKVVTAVWKKNDPEMIESLQEKGQNLVETITSAGIKSTFAVVESNDDEDTLVPAILDYAVKQEDIDLIFILTQQEIGIVEYFVGSHAQEFIRLSPIPVMSIIPKANSGMSIFS